MEVVEIIEQLFKQNMTVILEYRASKNEWDSIWMFFKLIIWGWLNCDI